MNKSAQALKWIAAFNSKDISSIMDFYSDSIAHTSPKIANYYTLENNTIKGKALLEDYFTQTIKNNPNLHFDLLQI